MAVLPVMKGITIIECDMPRDEILPSLGALQVAQPWYRIEADGTVGYVAAGAVVTNEDHLGYEEPSTLLSGPFL